MIKILLLEPLNESLLCQHCNLLMVEPIQTKDGDSVCKSCVKKFMLSNNIEKEFFEDKAKQKEINGLGCFCTFKNEKCEWFGIVKDLKDHLLVCSFKRDFEETEKLEYCPYVKMTCPDCKRNMIQDHKEHCHGSDPPYYATPSSSKVHEDYVSKCGILPEGLQKIIELNVQNKNLKAKIEDLKNRLENSNKEYDALKKTFDSYRRGWDEKVRKFESSFSFSHCSSDLIKKINNTISESDKKLVEVKNLLKQYDPSERKSMMDDLNSTQTHLKSLENEQAILQSSLSEHESKIERMNSISYNGVQKWRVKNIACLKHSALGGKTTLMYSPPCYLKKYGYKFCTRLVINKDGIRLSLVLMQSEFDVTLPWPFPYHVLIHVINTSDANQALIHTVNLDRNSKSFQQPSKEMNDPASPPLFVPFERLYDFVIDDSIFITTEVKNHLVDSKEQF